MVDTLFTNGVIAVREKNLLGDKLLRLAEGSLEEAFRTLAENGFGSGESAEAELLCAAEERSLDMFIREYAAGKAELFYLLAPRDFHNAKALCKAAVLRTDPDDMLAPEGLVPVSEMSAAIKSGELGSLPEELRSPCAEALENGGLSGAEFGALFDIALYRRLKTVCRRPLLKNLLAGRADRVNILTAIRSGQEDCEKFFVEGGSLSGADIKPLISGEMTKAVKKRGLAEFYGLCAEAREKGLPFTAAERALESFEAGYFLDHKYELGGREPFLYYVFRRRAEICNVRIILVCLGAGMRPQEIVRRLRVV